MAWIIYILVVLVVSILIGLHLGRFRIAYTEMSGMMLGMTMGMLNGFLIGYAAAAVSSSMFWGNLFGILLGLGLGVYYGRSGGLMGIMDGGMGGVMGGSMGAMLAIMVAFPHWAQGWTAVLLSTLYVLGMAGLVALIEQSAPDHAAFHRLLPMFARAIAVEAAEEAKLSQRRGRFTQSRTVKGSDRRIVDYYALLGVGADADEDAISESYFEMIEGADEVVGPRLERARSVLSDPQRRQSYDLKLAESRRQPSPARASGVKSSAERGEPPRQKQVAAPVIAASSTSPSHAVYNSTSKETTVRIMTQDSEDKQESQNGSGVPARPASGRSSSVPPSGASSAGTPSRATGSSQPQIPAQSESTGSSAKTGSGGKHSKTGSGTRAGKGQSPGQRQGTRTPQGQQVRYAQTQEPDQRSRVISVSWAGGIAFLVVIAVLGWWALSLGAARAGGSSSAALSGTTPNAVVGAAGETQAQLDQQAVTAQVGADGKQTLNVVLNSATFQYEPKTIKVKQGVPVRFNLSVINGDPG